MASFGISGKFVVPNYLYSEMYYPHARLIAEPQGREQIASIVAMIHLATQEEIRELAAFLVSGGSGLITGQPIYFTGGWS